MDSMDAVIAKLQKIQETISVESYHWDIPKGCPIAIPGNIETNYSRNIYLKENMSKHVAIGSDLSWCYWVINKWGRIGSLKENETNNNRIRKIMNAIKRRRLARDLFDRISSLSKVASFLQPERYSVYDSRVIYSLNWLIFNFSNDKQLFPQPAGRGSEIAKYDLQTIFRLSNKKYFFRSHKVAYNEYCELLNDLTPKIFGQNDKPYQLEMFLFLIAREWVVGNIQNSVSLNINVKMRVMKMRVRSCNLRAMI